MSARKVYLYDSVSADYDGHGTTILDESSGAVIYLAPETLQALNDYVARVKDTVLP